MNDENSRDEMLFPALEKLSADFLNLHWSHYDILVDGHTECVQRWLGEADEEVMVCVLSHDNISERFHRQDYFFINYAYRGSYDAVSYKFDNKITVREGDCYIGQPFSGYAIHAPNPESQVIIGVLIQKQTFYRSFLPLITADADLLRFFIDSRTNDFSDEFIHLHIGKSGAVQRILELMVIEYANKNEDTQNILKPLAVSLLMYIARECRANKRDGGQTAPLSAQIVAFMKSRMDVVSLSDIARHFGYHANYISSLLHKETGRTFSQILLSLRMERAVLLMQGTTLSLDEIAAMIGYGDTSNFYKAFRAHFGTSPREYGSGRK